MKPISCQTLLCCILLALTTLPGLAASAADAAQPALPGWQMLEYEQQAFFITANSLLEISAGPDDATHWQLTAHSSVASNMEEVELDLVAADGRARYRARLSKGKGERYKTWDFLPDMIVRTRRNPPESTTLPPSEWPISSRKEFAYPAAAAGMVVTDAYMLPVLARRLLDSGDDSTEVVVNTEFNFYRVRMTHNEGPAIKVNYWIAGAKAITGSQPTRAVTLEVSPLGKLAEKSDFSLLGLNDNISLLFGKDSKLLLQLRGSAPRIGKTEINLKAATLRTPSA